MTSRRTRSLAASLALLALGTGASRAEFSDEGLQPFQMVRSLQLVQDRIADGDHAALPMQRKLLEMIDNRFRSAESSSFDDRRNVHALMIYAMSGGNPATIADILARLDIDETDRQAAAGVLGYLLGDIAQARTAMDTIDPRGQPSEVAAFLSLVKGSVVAGDDADKGLNLLDEARLLGPGTLIEEAALRRTVTLAVSGQNVGRFLSASEQYARRYLRSPYAAQFAESFVSGILALRPHDLDLVRIEQAIDWMTREQAKTIYLRLARRAAIDVDAELLAFASRKAREYASDVPEQRDPRSELYSSISSVTSETVEEVLSQLRDLDSSRLSAGDRALLDAAKAVASGVVAPVAVRTPPVFVEPELEIDPELDADLDLELAPAPELASQPINIPADSAGFDQPTETDDLVLSARSKLEAIDKMLEETTR